MMRIKPSGDWEDFTKLSEEWPERVEFFLFEFAKQFALKTHKYMLLELNKIKGPKDYRRKLIVAEMREGNKSWFALAIKARSASSKDSENSVFHVMSKFDNLDKDPVKNILEMHSPWTIDSMPFAPSIRQALVTVRNASPEFVRSITKARQAEMGLIKEKMDKFGITFENRSHIMNTLKIHDSLEKQIEDMEFGAQNQKHWIPALRWARINLTKRLMRDKKLMAVLFDPDNKKWVNKKHLRDRIKSTEVREFYKFQEKLRKILPP